MRAILARLMATTLGLTAVGMTLILIILGYEIGIWLLDQGMFSGLGGLVVVAASPSVCALGSVPFWLAWMRMRRATS